MDKKALQEQFEEFARWYALPLDKSEDGIYRALETQSAWMSFQHKQAKVEEQAKEIANLKTLIQGHELRHQQNLSIKQKLTRRSEGLQKRVDALKTLATSWISEAESDESLSSEDWVSNVLNRCAEELEQALKGEG